MTTDAAQKSDQPSEALRYRATGSDLFDRHGVTTALMLRRLPGLVRRALGLAWRIDRRAVTVTLTCQGLSGVLGAVGLLAITGALAALIADGDITTRLAEALPSLCLLAGAFGARAILSVVVSSISTRLSPRITREAQLEMLKAAIGAELSAYDHAGFSDKQEAADRGADLAQELYAEAQDLTASLASLIAAAGVMTVLHPLLLPLVMLAALPQGIASMKGARVRYQASRSTAAEQVTLNHLRWHITTKASADQIRSATMADFLLNRYRTIGARIDAATDRAARSAAHYALAGSAAGGVATVAVWAALAWLLATGRMSLAAAGTAVFALRSVSSSLAGLVGYATRLFRSGLYLDDWTRFITEAGGHRLDRGSLTPGPPTVVRAERVSYTYPGAAEPAVHDVTLEIRRGQVLALVGENGSGKTTLSRLLAGLYLPDEGTVRWDAADSRDLDPHAMWEQTAVVPQNFARWPMTARENITLRPATETDEHTVRRAAEAAGAHEVIDELRSGMDTLLSYHQFGGVELSGGQWQRMAIARAFHRPAGLLVMDEPTSALDARAEHRIFTGLRAIAQDRAVVMVTHRLANVAIADHIVVLDHGRIVQSGGFDELTRAPGLFRELWELQNDRSTSQTVAAGLVPGNGATGAIPRQDGNGTQAAPTGGATA